MRSSGHTVKLSFLLTGILFLVLLIISLYTGKYPLSLSALLTGDSLQLKVFWNLRVARTLLALLGGFCLGITGFCFQTVFRNPLASPDIIGVSSGASAGAAMGILFLSGTISVTLSSFAGALITVLLALLLTRLDRTGQRGTIVLAGIAVHALAQTVLMFLKTTADPEKELAAIEYWIMGSLSGIRLDTILPNSILCIVCCLGLLFLYRQLLLLSMDRQEAGMLGVNVLQMQLITLLLSTLAVSSVICLTGIIGFVGLIAPHIARLLTRRHSFAAFVLAGLIGSNLLCFADILARSISTHELPISIFTSLLGAPLLICLIGKEARNR